MSQPKKHWDKYDQEAYELYELEEYLKRKGLLTKHDVNHVPKCYVCKGIGRKFDKLTYKPGDICPACGGRGFKVPKPKFTNGEAKKIVSQITPERIRELIRQYGETRSRR